VNAVFKTFWESGAVRLVVVYCLATGHIRSCRIFAEDGEEKQPSAVLESKRNIEDIWDDIWPRFKLFDKMNKELIPFDGQEDYLEQKMVDHNAGQWDDDYDYGQWDDGGYDRDWGRYDPAGNWILNSKYSDGWEE
jgi:hypothetical protein